VVQSEWELVILLKLNSVGHGTGNYAALLSSRVARRCSAQHQTKQIIWNGGEGEGKRSCKIASL